AGRRVAVASGPTLLEIAERNGVPLESGCRLGMCGADPVRIVSGDENLSPVAAAERVTLERLGLRAGTRLACCARVQGPVEFSLDTSGTEAAAADIPAGDPAIRRVVIV